MPHIFAALGLGHLDQIWTTEAQPIETDDNKWQ